MDKGYRLKALIAMIICFVLMSSAWALAFNPAYSKEVSDPTNILWWVIAGLLGIVQALVAYIYISGINSIKDDMRTLFEHIDKLEKEKLDIEVHDRLCGWRQRSQ